MTLKGKTPVEVIYTKDQGTEMQVTYTEEQATQTEKVNDIQKHGVIELIDIQPNVSILQ